MTRPRLPPADGCSPLRVLIACEFATLNGGERSLLAVLRELTNRIDPVVLAPARGDLASALAELRIPHRPCEFREDRGVRRPAPVLQAELLAAVAALKPQLVHANSLSLARLTGELAGTLPVPVTAHLRDIVRLSRAAVAAIAAHARLFAVSQAVADYHIAQGLPADKLHVLYNGVDLTQFRPAAGWAERDAVRTELGIDPEAPLLLAVGQIGLRKGLADTLQAASTLVPDFPTLQLAICGTRCSEKAEAVKHEQLLQKLAATEPLAGRVRWLGYRHDLPRVLRAADLLVHAALQEPFGRVLLEASASGLAIVATKVGGTAEMLRPEHSVLLCQPGDAADLAKACRRVLEDAALRARLGQAAQAEVRDRFPIAQSADQLLHQWQELAAGTKSLEL